MRRRKIIEQNYSDLMKVNITSSTMTVRQLRKYISLATNKINSEIEKYKGATKTSIDYLMNNIGSYRGKLVQRTEYMTKTDLLTRASLLRGHLRIYSDSIAKEKEMTEKTKKTYESLKKSLGDDELFTEEVFKELTQTLAGLGDALLEKLDSFQVASMFTEYRYSNQNEAYSLLDIIKQVYDEMINKDEYKGMEKQQFSEKLTDMVMERLSRAI